MTVYAAPKVFPVAATRARIVKIFARPALERLSSFDRPQLADVEALRCNIVARWPGAMIAEELAKVMDRVALAPRACRGGQRREQDEWVCSCGCGKRWSVGEDRPLQ